MRDTFRLPQIFVRFLVLLFVTPVVHAVIHIPFDTIIDDEIVFLQASTNNGLILLFVDFIVQVFILFLLDSRWSETGRNDTSKAAYLPVSSATFSCALVSSEFVQL